MNVSSAHLAILTALFAVTAFTLSLCASLWCNFVKFTSISSSLDDSITREFGMWNYQYYSPVVATDKTLLRDCKEYPDTMDLDTSWQSARAFIITSFTLACLIITFKLGVGCTGDPDKSSHTGLGKFISPTYLLIAIFQGLSLLFLNSKVCNKNSNPLLEDEEVRNHHLEWSENCSISTGAKCVISATVFWTAAAFSSYYEQKAWDHEHNTYMSPVMTEPLVPSNAEEATLL